MMTLNVTPQGGILPDSIMVAPVTDQSISLYQTVLRQGLEKCHISGNASVVQAAYRLSQIQEAIRHAAISANIPAKYFDQEEIAGAHHAVATIPYDQVFIPTQLNIQKLLLTMNNASDMKNRRATHLSMVQNRSRTGQGYQQAIDEAQHDLNLADGAYDLAFEVYFNSAERREKIMAINKIFPPKN
jgi:hypothetical protein